MLPSLWVMGVLLIPVMLWHGWDDRPERTAMLLWLLPLVEPPSSDWAEPLTGVFWYLVAYLWLVLLSPLLARCYQRARVLTATAPLALLAGWDSAPLLVGKALGSAVTDVLMFTACWVLGFAHRHGDLRRIAAKCCCR